MDNRPMLWPLLGAVRFFLALIVAASHLGPSGAAAPSVFVTWLASFDPLDAVFGFLVISGYSIAASYAKSPAGFYGRRLLRIWPLYILAIAAGCAAYFGTDNNDGFYGMPPTARILQNLFFLEGWTTYPVMCNAVIWTLSIEVCCYLATPIFARLSQSLLMIVIGTSALLFVLYPHLAVNPTDYRAMLHGQGFALLLWVWLMGFVAYRSRNHATAALLVGAVFVLIHHVNFALFLVIVCIGAGAGQAGPAWLASFGTRLGDASYPLYLFHVPIFIALPRLTSMTPPAVVVLGMAVLLALLLDRFFDQPVKRFFSSSGSKPWWTRWFSTQKVPAA